MSWLGTTTPFNISAAAATLGRSPRRGRRTAGPAHAVTGQRFGEKAAERIFALGAGHPWLTKRLGRPDRGA